MAKGDSKSNMLLHSAVKVKLLGEYLKAYLGVICNVQHTKAIHFYDLFCGPGVYGGGKHGSPMVIMKAIADRLSLMRSEGKIAPKISCHFNDVIQAKVLTAKTALIQAGYSDIEGVSLEFTSDDYDSFLGWLPQKFKGLKNEKAFVFIDPYDYKNIKLSHIRSLLNAGNSEVLLWLPTQFMYRFESNGTPKALKDFISEIVPFKEWKSSDSVWTFVDQLVNGFQLALGEDFMVDSFTIEKGKNTVFCLFFFTSHIKGFEKMLEAKWKVAPEGGEGWSYSGTQYSMFEPPKTNRLEEELRNYLNESPRTSGQLYEFTLRRGFLPTHCTQVLASWQRNGQINAELSDGTEARKNSFYINYPTFKTGEKSVLISFKKSRYGTI